MKTVYNPFIDDLDFVNDTTIYSPYYPFLPISKGATFAGGLQVTNANQILNFRLEYVAAFNTNTLRLLFTNYYGGGTYFGDGLAANPITVTCSFETVAPLGVTTENEPRIVATWNNSRTVTIDQYSFALTDNIPANLVAGQHYYLRVSVTAPTSGWFYPAGGVLLGGTVWDGVNNGEGQVSGVTDLTLDGAASIHGSETGTGAYGPSAILGLPLTPQHTVAAVGDSISAGIGDYGMGGARGGYIVRAIQGQTNDVKYTWPTPVTPAFGMVWTAMPSETLREVCWPANYSRRARIVRSARNIISNYGINDATNNFGSAEMCMDLVTFASQFTTSRFFQCTITPKASSSDGWATLANQYYSLTGVEEGYRRAFNNWLRDQGTTTTFNDTTPFMAYTSSAYNVNWYGITDGVVQRVVTSFPFLIGSEIVKINNITQPASSYTYLAQPTSTATLTYLGGGVNYPNAGNWASGITFNNAPASGGQVSISGTKFPSPYTQLPNWGGYYDAASLVEMNYNGQLGVNGGLWKPVTTIFASGTTTTSTSSTQTDTTQTASRRTWQGYTFTFTSGNARNQVQTIRYFDTGAFGFYSTFSPAPTTGDSYAITDGATIDGTHPTSFSARLMSTAIVSSGIPGQCLPWIF